MKQKTRFIRSYSDPSHNCFPKLFRSHGYGCESVLVIWHYIPQRISHGMEQDCQSTLSILVQFSPLSV
jgi:hypothetical protein